MSRPMLVLLPFILGGIVAVGVKQPLAGSAPRGTLLVANKGDQSLGIVDPKLGRQVATVAEGGTTGHEVIASPDGKLAYVPIYGDSGCPVGIFAMIFRLRGSMAVTALSSSVVT